MWLYLPNRTQDLMHKWIRDGPWFQAEHPHQPYHHQESVNIPEEEAGECREQRTGGVLWDAILGHEAMILLPCSWTLSRCDTCTRTIQDQISLNLSRNQQTILYPQPLLRSYLPWISARGESFSFEDVVTGRFPMIQWMPRIKHIVTVSTGLGGL